MDKATGKKKPLQCIEAFLFLNNESVLKIKE